MKKLFTLFIISFTISASAQAVVINTDGSTADPSAMLDVSSTTKGFLPPRLTYFQKTQISSPVAGLTIWCSNCGLSGEMQVFNGNVWTNIIGGVAKLAFPTVDATTAATSITGSSASSGGNILSDGGSTITARGVCWSTSQNPTISDSKTTDTGTTGIFTSSLTGLVENTTYYVRAYATNSLGTSYGTQISFLAVLSIGTQYWMEKNLEVTTYRNGDVIPEVTDSSAWASLTTGAWCYYHNNPENGASTGKLYNWYAVNDPRGLAPTGWHIPTDAELTILTNYLGETVAGGKMKSVGTTRWKTPNLGATNESGFSGFPGGYRSLSGTFTNIGNLGFWWSTTFSSSTNAWCRTLDFNNSFAIRTNTNKRGGFSIRCIRD